MEDMEKKLAFLLASSPHFMLKGGSSTYGKAAKDFIANGVVVREKGKWMEGKKETLFRKQGNYICSNCESHTGIVKFNFCPNCGADMRKG